MVFSPGCRVLRGVKAPMSRTLSASITKAGGEGRCSRGFYSCTISPPKKTLSSYSRALIHGKFGTRYVQYMAAVGTMFLIEPLIYVILAAETGRTHHVLETLLSVIAINML